MKSCCIALDIIRSRTSESIFASTRRDDSRASSANLKALNQCRALGFQSRVEGCCHINGSESLSCGECARSDFARILGASAASREGEPGRRRTIDVLELAAGAILVEMAKTAKNGRDHEEKKR